MKIRLLVGLSGPTINMKPGDELEVTAAQAAGYISAGFAVPVSEPQIERAVKPAASEIRKGK